MMQANESAPAEKTLTFTQRQAALLLAQNRTIDATAAECKVAPITIIRWKKLPHFMAEMHAREDELYQDELRQIKKAAGAARACLIVCMSEKVSPYVRVQAASKLLDLGLQVHSIAQLQAEVDELKRLLTEREPWQQ